MTTSQWSQCRWCRQWGSERSLLQVATAATSASAAGQVVGYFVAACENADWCPCAVEEFPAVAAALAVLEEAGRYSDGTPDSLVFPSSRGRQITPDALSKLCHELNLGMTPPRAPLIVQRLVRRDGRQS